MNMLKCPLDFDICSLSLTIRMARSTFIGLSDVGLSVWVKTRFTTASVDSYFQGRSFDFDVLSVWPFWGFFFVGNIKISSFFKA